MSKYKCIPCNMWDIFVLKQHLLFIWNANLLGTLYFYLLNLATSSPGWSWKFWRKENQFSFWKLLTWGQRSSSFRHHLATAPATKLCPKYSFRICGGSLAPTEQGKLVQRDHGWGLNLTPSRGDGVFPGKQMAETEVQAFPREGHGGHQPNKTLEGSARTDLRDGNQIKCKSRGSLV